MALSVSSGARRRRLTTGRHRLGALIAAACLTAALTPSALADGATVTRGDIHPFATGIGLPVSGHAEMIRTADGRTIVSVHVEGLAASTTYASHVHKLACANTDADGHYRLDPNGPAAPPNEIWPGPFTTTPAGIGNGNVTVEYTAGPDAVSVVVHAPGGAKIACADLG
jgi:hypothetical protein